MNYTKQVSEGGIEASQFFNLILENFKIASIFILNKEGTILNINTGAQKTLGYSYEDLIGNNFALLFTQEDRIKKMPEKELSAVLDKGSATDNNFILHKSGRPIWVHGESAFTKDHEGNIYIVKIVYDISDQKFLEQSLKEKNEELQKKNKNQDTFVYTASHDLKAPINNIESLVNNLYSEISEEDKKKNEIKEIIEMINISIDKFKKTINDLSIIGKVEEEVYFDISQIYFQDILEDVKSNLKKLIKDTDPVFIENFSKAPTIKFSRKILRSIFQNLISNAMKYRSPQRKPEVIISTENINGEHILLKIKDNGLGIKEKDKSKIFYMYKRLHEHVEGTGVGMSIVKRMLDNTDSTIEVESEVDKGTTFSIYLKIMKE